MGDEFEEASDSGVSDQHKNNDDCHIKRTSVLGLVDYESQSSRRLFLKQDDKMKKVNDFDPDMIL